MPFYLQIQGINLIDEVILDYAYGYRMGHHAMIKSFSVLANDVQMDRLFLPGDNHIHNL